MQEKFNEDYYLRGKEKNISNYSNYRWLPDLTMPMAKALMKFMCICPGDKVLDYGCARGYLVKALRIIGVHSYGCDISSWAINNCDQEVKDYVGFSLDDRGYDYVFCKDVLEHVPTDNLDELLPKLFSVTKKSSLFIVPLATHEGGPYIYPCDELDSTHIHRKTLTNWMELIGHHASNFLVFGSLYIPTLKASSESYPGSTGFIYCKKIMKE